MIHDTSSCIIYTRLTSAGQQGSSFAAVNQDSDDSFFLSLDKMCGMLMETDGFHDNRLEVSESEADAAEEGVSIPKIPFFFLFWSLTYACSLSAIVSLFKLSPLYRKMSRDKQN